MIAVEEKSQGSYNLTEGLTFQEAFDRSIQLVEDSLKKSPALIRTYTSHLAEAKGKNLRAACLIACAQQEDGLIHPDAIRFAASMEILHLATLVHDDVIDNAPTRRGIATIQHKFGKKNAVICGDYLFCLSLRLAFSVSEKEHYLALRFPQYMEKICMGELRQNLNNKNLNLSILNYMRIISGKTAALFEACFTIGAFLSGAEESQGRRYARLGHVIGMIFQLTDDCIDFEAPEDLAKKPVHADLEQGVVTLPVIYAIRENSHLAEMVEHEELTGEALYSAVVETGGLSFTKVTSKRYYNKARKFLDTLNPPEEKRERLEMILEKAFAGVKKKV